MHPLWRASVQGYRHAGAAEYLERRGDLGRSVRVHDAGRRRRRAIQPQQTLKLDQCSNRSQVGLPLGVGDRRANCLGVVVLIDARRFYHDLVAGPASGVVQQSSTQGREALPVDEFPEAGPDEPDQETRRHRIVERDAGGNCRGACGVWECESIGRVEAIGLRRVTTGKGDLARVGARKDQRPLTFEHHLKWGRQAIHVLSRIGAGLILQRVENADVDAIYALQVTG